MKRKSTLFTALVMLWILAGATSTWGAAGDLLWEKTYNFLPDYEILTQIKQVDVSSTLVSICCDVGHSNPDGSGEIFYAAIITTFDISTGVLKWERRFPDYTFNKLKFNGNIVFIQNSYSSLKYHYNRYGYYNANTGQTLWEKSIDSPVSPPVISIPSPAPYIDNNRLVIVTRKNTDVNVKVFQVQDVTIPAVNSLLLDK